MNLQLPRLVEDQKMTSLQKIFFVALFLLKNMFDLSNELDFSVITIHSNVGCPSLDSNHTGVQRICQC